MPVNIAVNVQSSIRIKGSKTLYFDPWQIEGDKWQLWYMPVPTDQCDLCADRVGKGKLFCVAQQLFGSLGQNRARNRER